MGDLIYGIDFRSKKRFEPVKSPLQDGLETIARELSLQTPPEILVAIYESSIGWVAPEKDPA